MTNKSYQLTIALLLIASLALVRAQPGLDTPAPVADVVAGDQTLTFDPNNGDNAGEELMTSKTNVDETENEQNLGEIEWGEEDSKDWEWESLPEDVEGNEIVNVVAGRTSKYGPTKGGVMPGLEGKAYGEVDWTEKCPDVEEPIVPKPIKLCDEWMKYGRDAEKLDQVLEGAILKDSNNKFGSNWETRGKTWNVYENRCANDPNMSSVLALARLDTKCPWNANQYLNFTTCGRFDTDKRHRQWCADPKAPWCQLDTKQSSQGKCVSEKPNIVNGNGVVAHKWNFDDIPASCFDPEHKSAGKNLQAAEKTTVESMFACHFSRCGAFVAEPEYSTQVAETVAYRTSKKNHERYAKCIKSLRSRVCTPADPFAVREIKDRVREDFAVCLRNTRCGPAPAGDAYDNSQDACQCMVNKPFPWRHCNTTQRGGVRVLGGATVESGEANVLAADLSACEAHNLTVQTTCNTGKPDEAKCVSPHYLQYAKCLTLSDDDCTAVRPDSSVLTPDGSVKPDQPAHVQRQLDAWYNCLWERSNVGVTTECRKNLLELVSNPFYLICVRDGKTSDPDRVALIEQLVADGFTGEVLEEEEYAALERESAKKVCKHFMSHADTHKCVAWEVLNNVSVTHQEMEQYTWPFLRFWIRQSRYTAPELNQKVHPTECAAPSTYIQESYSTVVDTYDTASTQSWCDSQTVGAANLLNSAYEENFFNHACPPNFDNEQDVSKDMPDQDCGKNFTGGAFGYVYCHPNFPFCRPTQADDSVWKCMTAADKTYPVVDYHPAKEWSNAFIPPLCAGDDANADASMKDQKEDCLRLLSDIKTWYWMEGDQDRATCNHGGNQTRGSSEITTQVDNFCGTYKHNESDIEVFCDRFSHQYCNRFNVSEIGQGVCQEVIGDNNESNFNFKNWPWMCRPLSYRWPTGIVRTQDEFEYGQENYWTTTQGHQKRSLEDATRHVLSYCRFDVGLQAKARNISLLRGV